MAGRIVHGLHITALACEYHDAISLKFSVNRLHELQPLLTERLGDQAEFVTVWFSWRPSSLDHGDDHVIDCAMNARAAVVTATVRDFGAAVKDLGLKVMTTVKFLEYLSSK